MSIFASVLACWAHADTGVDNLLVSQSFQLRAQVTAGCLLGSGSGDVTSFGTISFGPLASLGSDVSVVSTLGAGSIMLQCTPGTPLSVALDSGVNATTIGGGRYLAKGSELLRYQLFQDAGYSTIWGNSSNGGQSMGLTAPSSGIQTLSVYARLFSVSPLPSAGTYSDLVIVNVTY